MDKKKPNFGLEGMKEVTSEGQAPTIYEDIVIYGSRSYQDPTVSEYQADVLGCKIFVCCSHSKSHRGEPDFSERIKTFLERYEWNNDETRNLIRHFLTSVAHPHLREKPIEYLSEIFDQQILMLQNEKIDKKMIYDAVEKIHSSISPDIFPEVKRMLDDYLHSIK
jgi:transcriptional regulator of aromatic amino acid metabolism